MTTLKILPAKLVDASRIELREADIRELQEFSVKHPKQTLIGSIRLSEQAFSVTDQDNQLVCIFGVASHPNNPTIGYPWMLCSELVGTYPRESLRQARKVLSKWLETYRVLVNYVHVDNTSAIRWLTLLDARLEHTVEMGPNSASFKQFTFRMEN